MYLPIIKDVCRLNDWSPQSAQDKEVMILHAWISYIYKRRACWVKAGGENAGQKSRKRWWEIVADAYTPT